jgi:hypothetical protein
MRVIRSILLCRGRWRDWLTAARLEGLDSPQLISCYKDLTAWPASSRRCLPASLPGALLIGLRGSAL